MAVKAYPGSFTWEEAKSKCSQDGSGAVKGELAAPHNSIENNWFVDKAKELGIGSSGSLRFWLGVNDIGEEGSYKNQHGTSQNYFNWVNGSPTSSKTEHDCVRTSNTYKYNWYEVSCTGIGNVLCTYVASNGEYSQCFQFHFLNTHLQSNNSQ